MKIGKVFLIGLALLLAFSMTVMAGGSRSGSTSDSSSAAASPQVTTITVWSNDAHNKVLLDQLVAEFNRTTGAQKNIKVEYTVYGADWQTAMNMAGDTDRLPDMFKGYTNVTNHQAQGKLLAWTDIPGASVQRLLTAQAPYHVNNSTTFGGVPYSVSLYGWFSVLHYNKSLLQRAGYSAPPKTWAEVEAMSIAISKLEPGKIYGYGIPLLWNPDYCHWVTEYMATSSVGHMYWDFTEGKYNFADFTDYFEMIGRIRDGGAMFPGMESLSDDQLRAQFAAGNIGFITGAGWNVGVLYDQFPFGGGDSGKPNNPSGWDFAPMPSRDPNNAYAVPISAGASYYVASSVKNNAAKLNAMADVIELFCGDKTQIAQVSGSFHMANRPDISAQATPERAQWLSYGKSVTKTVAMPEAPHDKLAVEGADRAAVIGQILTGQIPVSGIRAALTDLDRRMNAAFEQAVTRGTIKRADYIVPSFQTNLRAR